MEDNFNQVYDSGGECGPFVRMEDIEGEQIFDEPELVEKKYDNLEGYDGGTLIENNERDGVDIDEMEGDSEAAEHNTINEVDLVKMSRELIKNYLRLRGQRLSGEWGRCWKD